MKKTLMTLMVIALVAFLAVGMVGCSAAPAEEAPAEEAAVTEEAPAEAAAASTIEGTTWKLVSIIDPDGNVIEGEALATEVGGADVTYEFKADGVVTGTVGDQSVDATYEDLGDKIIMTDAAGTESTFVFDGVDGTTMAAEVDGVTSVFAIQ